MLDVSIETVLFDFDGTLANTNALISQSHLAVLEEYFPGEYDLEGVRAFNGPTLEMVYGKLNPLEKETMIAKYRQFNEAHHDEMVTVFEGVTENLERLKSIGIRLAIVSSKRNDVLLRGLKLLHLTDYFEVIIGGLDYQKAKPDPEPIYVALQQLKVDPAKAIMVGDNSHDIESANNAGIISVFVEWSEKTRAEIDPFKPDVIVTSMTDLTDYVIRNK